MTKLLEIENLSVEFDGFKAVDGVNLSVDEGKVVGIVGESGSGKSVTQLALMGLIPYPGIIKADRLMFHNSDLMALSAKKRRSITGKDVSMIFQEPMTSLNPCFTVEYQISEALKIHEGGTRQERRKRVIELLSQVGIPAPEDRLGTFPHQLSGGMSQRVMIAMAIACSPRLLIADEPTTALDVTIQAQILELIMDLQQKKNMALVLITHDMAVIAETVEDVVVMYAGQVVEKNSSDRIFTNPCHPYTEALLNALPERNINSKRLPTIPGLVPGKFDRPDGCLFHPRCKHAKKMCKEVVPKYSEKNSIGVRCHFPLINGVPQYD
ncbi:dipeptide transporter; ATP-binding component of ABC superfamily [Desulfamplus magnetovallimortis]|uniref:Dipeptide transporter ATP-binding component of ABC superfamily n=1 Tax=Desulfamplus magnetovallimortis TaxID=1246637 RepID=A0A1W1HH86_9BACT|nr:oligopeptide/dipeptide ABC transporter ATP-binding protein [Desulfamplus magnetovallimortis]SLM31742.1 dipeptide transporter; ATP-binding component of ABC superfamily [Desulfamplus magnetovallimortis]